MADMFYCQVLSKAGSISGNQTSLSLSRLSSPLMSDALQCVVLAGARSEQQGGELSARRFTDTSHG